MTSSRSKKWRHQSLKFPCRFLIVSYRFLLVYCGVVCSVLESQSFSDRLLRSLESYSQSINQRIQPIDQSINHPSSKLVRWIVTASLSNHLLWQIDIYKLIATVSHPSYESSLCVSVCQSSFVWIATVAATVSVIIPMGPTTTDITGEILDNSPSSVLESRVRL